MYKTFSVVCNYYFYNNFVTLDVRVHIEKTRGSRTLLNFLPGKGRGHG